MDLLLITGVILWSLIILLYKPMKKFNTRLDEINNGLDEFLRKTEENKKNG
jgi:hypothetical protein